LVQEGTESHLLGSLSFIYLFCTFRPQLQLHKEQRTPQLICLYNKGRIWKANLFTPLLEKMLLLQLQA